MTTTMKHPFSFSLLLCLTMAGTPSLGLSMGNQVRHSIQSSMGNQVRHSIQSPHASSGRPFHYGDNHAVPTTMHQQLMSTAAPLPANDVPTGNWRDQLLKASNTASLLCVLDCTILPIVTIVLPLFGLVAASPAQMEALHQLGHQTALFFVLPVGGSATLLNYLYAHRKKRIALVGVLGLFLVFLANFPHGWIHSIGQSNATLSLLLHTIHQGVTHRVVNILGCASLLLSNYWSRQAGQCLMACCDPTVSPSKETSTDAELTAFVTYAHAKRDRRSRASSELQALRSDLIQ